MKPLAHFAPSVSIVILNYNGEHFIGRCLESVLRTEYERYEVIVVDNASTDSSLEIIKQFVDKGPNLRKVSLTKNYGYGLGNNEGYAKSDAGSKYVVFLNNDTIVNKHWLMYLVRAMEDDQSIGAAQPRILSMDGIIEPFTGFMNVFGDSTIVLERDMKIPERFFASGCALIVRKSIIDRIGLFNRSFFAYYEDTDLSWRIRLNGYSIAYIRDAVVLHKGRATAKKVPSRLMSFESSKNRLYMLILNYSLKNLLKYGTWTAFSLLFHCISNVGFYNVRKKTVYLTAAIGQIEGLFYIVKNFSQIWNERIVTQKAIRRISDKELLGKYILLPNPCLPRDFIKALKDFGLLESVCLLE